MTVLDIEKIPVLFKGKPTKRSKLKILLQCDECSKTYFSSHDKRRIFKMKHHFCSILCSRKSFVQGVIKEEIKKTCNEKYGADCFASSKIGRNKLNTACLDSLGHISAFSNATVREKIKQTCLEKYGNETYTGSEDHQSKLNYTEIAQKAWQTKIKNGSCSKSEPEEKMFSILKKYFGNKNVDRQKNIINQWVDFYISSDKFYLQVDGVYWHGLNRPLKEIKLQKTSQDVKIYKQILRDKELNKYMKKNNLILIRITDEEVNKLKNNEIIQLIKERYHASLYLLL